MKVTIQMSSECKELGANLVNSLYEYSEQHGIDLAKEIVHPEDVMNDGVYAFADGEFAGGLLYYISNDWVFLTNGYVFPAYRNRGIYTLLINAMEEYVISKCLSGIFASTYEFQAPWFYEQRGFTKGAVLPDCPKGNTSIDYYKILKEAGNK